MQSDYVELSNDPAPPTPSTSAMTSSTVHYNWSPASSTVLRRRRHRPASTRHGRSPVAAAEPYGGSAGPAAATRRLCGENVAPVAFRSESNFYRVTFRSNEIWDQTGFTADYEFRSASGANRRDYSSSSSSSSSSGS